MTDLYLAVSATSLTDFVQLQNAPNYRVAQNPGLQFGVYPRGVASTAGQQPPGVVPISMVLYVSGGFMDQVEANWRAVERKLEQARRAAIDTPQGTPVFLWFRPNGASNFVYYPIVDGSFLYRPTPGLKDGTLFKAGTLTLLARPYPQGDADSSTYPVSATLTNGALASPVYLPGVAGDVEALCKLLITDVSTGGKIIQRLRISVRTGQPLLSTDFTSIYAVTPASPGASNNDGTGVNAGAYARLTGATANWQTVAKVVGATSGARQNGRFDVWAKVRDSSAPALSPSGNTAVSSGTGGNLLDGFYTALMTAYDGSGNESFPVNAGAVTVPVTATTFYDGFEGGDFGLWNAVPKVTISSGGLSGTMNIVAAAAHNPQGAVQGVLGARASAANSAAGGTAAVWVAKTIPGGGTTCAMRYWLRINSDTNAADNEIVLCTDSGGGVLTYLTNGGGSWLLVISGENPANYQLAGISEGDWQRVEYRISWNGTNITHTLLVNDTQTATRTAITASNAPNHMVCGVRCFSGASAAIQADFDDVQIQVANIGANTGSVVYTWTAGTGASGYYLYVSRGAGSGSGTIRRIDVGNVTTYTLTSNSAGSIINPPTTAPPVGFGQFRMRFELAGTVELTPLYTTGASTILGGSKWEWIRIGTGVLLPPAPPQDGAGAPPWQFFIEAKSGSTNTPNLDIDEIVLCPVDEAYVEVTAPAAALASLAQWQIDINPFGFVSCQVYTANGVTRIGQATVSGQLTIGPGDTQITVFADVSDGSGHFVADVVNAKYTLQAIPTYRYRQWRGAA